MGPSLIQWIEERGTVRWVDVESKFGFLPYEKKAVDEFLRENGIEVTIEDQGNVYRQRTTYRAI